MASENDKPKVIHEDDAILVVSYYGGERPGNALRRVRKS